MRGYGGRIVEGVSRQEPVHPGSRGVPRLSVIDVTNTDRRTLASVNAALNQAPPPPTITTS